MATARLTVRLSGDGPWGFRLQGGTEPGVPLTVAKVRVKSKAHGLLEEGDILLAINGWPCENMSYDDVVDVLDSAGQELELEVARTEENLAPQVEKQAVAMETESTQNVNEEFPPPPPPIDNKEEERETAMVNGVASDSEQPQEEGMMELPPHETEEQGQIPEETAAPAAEVAGTDKQGLLPERDDVITTFEREVTPEGFSERTTTRQVTSEPHVKGEVTTETLSEKHGNTELFSHRHQEYEERRSPLLGGRGVMAPQPGIGSMFNVSKFSSNSSSFSQTWSPSVGLKSSSVTKKTESFSSKTTSNVFSSHQTSSFVSQQASSTGQAPSPLQPPPPPPQVTQEAPAIPQAPPPPPMPPSNEKQRPYSLPPLDFNILEAIEKNKISLVGSQKQKTQQQQQKQQQQQQNKGIGKQFGTAPSKTKDGHTINANDEESRKFQMLMKAFQPPPEDEGIITPRRRKMFASSSFYDEPQHKYPTVEEQVKLCKSIADSLSAETNKMSRGATMYLKRMNRSFNWVHEGPDPTSSEDIDAESSEYEANTPEVKGGDFHPLKLVLDPRHLKDAMKLAKTGMYNEHNVISPDICFDLVRDLNSPTGKGAQLFAKRKKKSEKWVVDEDSVKEAVKEAAAKHVALADIAANLPTSAPTAAAPVVPPAPAYIPQNKLQDIQDRLHPRVKLIKSPWEAALESPYGSCDAAFEVSKPPPPPITSIVPSMVSKIEQREAVTQPPLPPLTVNTHVPATQVDMRLFSPRPYSPSQAPPLPQTFETARSGSPYAHKANIYKPKAPKGWSGYSGDQSMYSPWVEQESTNLLDTSFSSDVTEPSSFQRFQLDQLPNYNNVARAWGYGSTPHKGFRPVRPSSAVFSK